MTYVPGSSSNRPSTSREFVNTPELPSSGTHKKYSALRRSHAMHIGDTIKVKVWTQRSNRNFLELLPKVRKLHPELSIGQILNEQYISASPSSEDSVVSESALTAQSAASLAADTRRWYIYPSSSQNTHFAGACDEPTVVEGDPQLAEKVWCDLVPLCQTSRQVYESFEGVTPCQRFIAAMEPEMGCVNYFGLFNKSDPELALVGTAGVKESSVPTWQPVIDIDRNPVAKPPELDGHQTLVAVARQGLAWGYYLGSGLLATEAHADRNQQSPRMPCFTSLRLIPSTNN
uniref:Uncharacterized protein n=1 Tax=Timema monikensis TaxID=170555 RepID=A0A7R9HT68_9NEOP|nr:unnamed protein product [Timema monikensis]